MVTLHQLKKGCRITKKFRSKVPGFKSRTTKGGKTIISPQKKGTVMRLDILKPKKPNSAKRKTARVRLRNGREIQAYIPGIGHNVVKHSDVLVRGGRVPDLPGVRYHIIRHKYDFTANETFDRRNKRSKYGVKIPKPLTEKDLENE